MHVRIVTLFSITRCGVCALISLRVRVSLCLCDCVSMCLGSSVCLRVSASVFVCVSMCLCVPLHGKLLVGESIEVVDIALVEVVSAPSAVGQDTEIVAES